LAFARLVRLSLAASSTSAAVNANQTCTDFCDPTAIAGIKTERCAANEINNNKIRSSELQSKTTKTETASPAHSLQQQTNMDQQLPSQDNNKNVRLTPFARESSAADASAAVAADVAVGSRSASVCSALSCSVESCCSTSSHVPPSELKAEGAG
jgi:hypothetical protein